LPKPVHFGLVQFFIGAVLGKVELKKDRWKRQYRRDAVRSNVT
jgi:hypothetical protein